MRYDPHAIDPTPQEASLWTQWAALERQRAEYAPPMPRALSWACGVVSSLAIWGLIWAAMVMLP